MPAVIILNPSRLLSENKFPHLVPFSKFSLTLTTSVVPSTSKNKGTRLGCPIGSFLSTHLLLLLGPMPRHAACTAPLISMAASPYRWPSMSICLRTVCRNSCSPLAAASRPVGLKNILSWHGLFFLVYSIRYLPEMRDETPEAGYFFLPSAYCLAVLHVLVNLHLHLQVLIPGQQLFRHPLRLGAAGLEFVSRMTCVYYRYICVDFLVIRNNAYLDTTTRHTRNRLASMKARIQSAQAGDPTGTTRLGLGSSSVLASSIVLDSWGPTDGLPSMPAAF